MKKIDVSDSTFEDLIKGGSIYVDKTEYIYKLINSSYYINP